jgi:hypothetical protein
VTVATLRGVDEMQRQLQTLASRSLPFAARETVNGMAFAGRAAWQEEMRHALTLRNRFTERRALVERATTLRMSRMQAVLGHTEPYMATLEGGGAERADKRFRPIPTEVAAGQAKGSTKSGRKRAVRVANIITHLSRRIPGGGKSGSRKARNAKAIQGAIRTGRRLALLDLGKRKGIFRITGRKKLNISMLYDLTRRVTPVPRVPTLRRAVERASAKGPELASRALEKQFERLKGHG